jgi:hypothetical protein
VMTAVPEELNVRTVRALLWQGTDRKRLRLWRRTSWKKRVKSVEAVGHVKVDIRAIAIGIDRIVRIAEIKALPLETANREIVRGPAQWKLLSSTTLRRR